MGDRKLKESSSAVYFYWTEKEKHTVECRQTDRRAQTGIVMGKKGGFYFEMMREDFIWVGKREFESLK